MYNIIQNYHSKKKVSLYRSKTIHATSFALFIKKKMFYDFNYNKCLYLFTGIKESCFKQKLKLMKKHVKLRKMIAFIFVFVEYSNCVDFKFYQISAHTARFVSFIS